MCTVQYLHDSHGHHHCRHTIVWRQGAWQCYRGSAKRAADYRKASGSTVVAGACGSNSAEMVVRELSVYRYIGSRGSTVELDCTLAGIIQPINVAFFLVYLPSAHGLTCVADIHTGALARPVWRVLVACRHFAPVLQESGAQQGDTR